MGYIYIYIYSIVLTIYILIIYIHENLHIPIEYCVFHLLRNQKHSFMSQNYLYLRINIIFINVFLKGI